MGFPPGRGNGESQKSFPARFIVAGLEREAAPARAGARPHADGGRPLPNRPQGNRTSVQTSAEMNMDKIQRYVGTTVRRSMTAAAAAVLLALGTSCTDLVYDGEGDCTVTYRLKFRYDLNLKWADAFANEVGSVRLYAFGPDGVLAAEYRESGERLAQEDYGIVLDLPAGDYHLLAWCGVDNPGAARKDFHVPEAEVGRTTLEEMTCRLERRTVGDDPAVSDGRLEFMFHGSLDVTLPEDEDGGEYVYTMPLTKDTNHLRVVLQHLSGEDLDVSQFGFRIEEANGWYAHDNNLLEDEVITYKAYATSSGVAGIVRGGEETRSVVNAKTAVADFSLGRMMAGRASRMVLTITNGEGNDIARIPVIDYALLAKDYYELAYGHPMENQEFLDREDEYMMTFFIDEDMTWYAAEIYIQSWRIVLHDYEIG